MKKAKIKPSPHEVDGPFRKAKERLLDFGESLYFSDVVQRTVEQLKLAEEEYKLAIFMDDPDLAIQKKREVDELTKSLTYASKLLE